MTHILSLGAINKTTREYVYPKIANKKDKYVCLDCNKDLILCKGQIKRPHFRHKVDTVNPCNYYNNPTETQIHKDGKMLIKKLLESKIPVSFSRKCCSCNKDEEYEIPEITYTSNIVIEYRFEYNGLKIADVAYIDNGELFCIFEICNTHKTCSENRPEPFFEIDANTLIELANNGDLSQIKIPCIRCVKCEECVEKEHMEYLKNNDLRKYIRIKLGQTIFPTEPVECKYYTDADCKSNCNCGLHNEPHLRLDFHSINFNKENKEIIELFSEFYDYKNIKVVVRGWKGSIYVRFVELSDYSKNNYWEDTKILPFIKDFGYAGDGTVEIIYDIINNLKSIDNFVECRYYRLCHTQCPRRVINTHNGMCINCAMMLGRHTYTNNVEKCSLCSNSEEIVLLKCKHKVCNPCWFKIYKNRLNSNKKNMCCPLCFKKNDWC